MREIQLTQGYVALVDDADYEWLNQWRWSAYFNPKRKTAVAARKVWIAKSKSYINLYMHRVITDTTNPKMHVDHKDMNPLNNQRENLRVCTKSQNMRNVKSRGGTSNFKGVVYFKHSNKWRACITVDNKNIHLGLYDNELDAAMAYNDASIKYHGEYGRLNEIPNHSSSPVSSCNGVDVSLSYFR